MEAPNPLEVNGLGRQMDFPGFSGHLIGSLQLPVGNTYTHPIYAETGSKDLRVHQESTEVPQHQDDV
jgi:hypothetical protein